MTAIRLEVELKDGAEITQGEIERYFEMFHSTDRVSAIKIRTDAVHSAMKCGLFESNTIKYALGNDNGSTEWMTLDLTEDWDGFTGSKIKAIQALGQLVINITTSVAEFEIDPN